VTASAFSYAFDPSYGGILGTGAYATPADLAIALGESFRVTTENQQLLQDCLDAAAAEIDHILVDAEPSFNPHDPTDYRSIIVKRVNVNRAVEWFKAPATYNGGVGTNEIGALAAPASGFARHAAVLMIVRSNLGVA
jgi:hypothetical protein